MTTGITFRLSLRVATFISILSVAAIPLLPTKASAAGTPPTALTFQSPPQVATAGQTVTLQWGAVPAGNFVILFTPRPYPSGFDFSSPLSVRWPTPPGGGWNQTYGFWASTSTSVSVVIPTGSAPTTTFTFDLFTCSFITGCSNANQATITVVDMANVDSSSLAVVAGTNVSLHWQPPKPGDFFLLIMPSSTYPLNFGSTSVVQWPNPPGGMWYQTYGMWASTADAVSVSVPQGAAAGASFTFDLITCNLLSGKCSSSPGGPGMAAVTMTVVGPEWSVAPYGNDFTMSIATQAGGGVPLDAAVSPITDFLFESNEFSNSVGVAAPGQTTVALKPDAWDNVNTPFVSCVVGPICKASGSSDLGERVVVDANGLVWFTQGGALFYPGATPNHSEIAAFDPNSGGICTYGVPGNNPEVLGLVATGSGIGETIWFAASGAQALDSFVPSQVGENCASSPYYSLAGQSTFHQVQLPDSPAMVSADPNGTTLWVSGLFGEINRVDTQSGKVTRYAYSGTNKYYCVSTNGVCVPVAFPWQVVSDGTYVYAIDYGDDNLVRINETTGHVDETPIPVASDTEQGYGLTMVKVGSDTRLYFTLSQDAALLTTWTSGMTTTLGWVDLTSWNAASADPSQAVVYSGLDAAVSSTPSDFRGIASGSTGDLAIADSSHNGTAGVIHLIPKALP